MRTLAAALASSLLAAPAPAEFFKEPRTGVTFVESDGDLSLLGMGVRTKTFLKVKVYAIALYVARSALTGPLSVHRGKVGTSAFYGDLIAGDFGKQIVLKPVRNLSAEQVQDAFRSHMPAADGTLLDRFLSYFHRTRPGQECVLRWAEGGILETSVAGVSKPPIADRAFSEAVFAIWLGDKPVEDKLRKSLVSRADQLLR